MSNVDKVYKLLGDIITSANWKCSVEELDNCLVLHGIIPRLRFIESFKKSIYIPFNKNGVKVIINNSYEDY